MAVDKRIFPSYEIPGSRAVGTTEKNAAYSTLPQNSVRPIKRTNRQVCVAPNFLNVGFMPLFTYTVGNQEYLDITSIKSTLYGNLNLGGVNVTHTLNFTGVFGPYAGTIASIEYLSNDKTIYQIDVWAGFDVALPAQQATGDTDIPNAFESDASDNYFHLIVKPNETFKIGIRNIIGLAITLLNVGLSEYDNVYYDTVICGRLIPKQTFEQIQKESGYSL